MLGHKIIDENMDHQNLIFYLLNSERKQYSSEPNLNYIWNANHYKTVDKLTSFRHLKTCFFLN